MATTFSNNYQIKLIGTGLEAGTWGDSTNLNYQKLEQAIGGNTSITLDGTLPTGSSYDSGSNTLKLVTNELVDPSDSGAEPRSHYIKITNGSALSDIQEVEFCGSSETSPADRVFIVENALDLSATQDQYGDLILRSINGSTGINLPHGSIAVVYTDGDKLYNALSQLFITSLDMSEAAADIIINGDNASALEILDNRTHVSTHEFQRDVYLKIGTDSTPSFDVFPTINTTSELANSTFTVQSDKNTFGTDTSGTTPYIEGKGDEGLEARGGSTGAFSKLGLNHGTNSDVDLVTAGTGQVVVGSTLGHATIRSAGTYNLVIQAGSDDNSTITIEDAANGDITIAPNGSGGLLLTGDSYMNFSSTKGSGGYGLYSDSSVLKVSNRDADGWGQPYHAGMTSGTGASSGYFTGTNTSISNSTAAYAFTHDFTTLPSIVKYYLQNNSGGAIANYANTDMIDISGFTSLSDEPDTQSQVIQTWLTTTQVGISIYINNYSTYPFHVLNKTSGAVVDIDLTDWDLVVRAWK